MHSSADRRARVQDMGLVRESMASIESRLLELKAENSHAVVRHPSTELLGDPSPSFSKRAAGTSQQTHFQIRSSVLQVHPQEPVPCLAWSPVHPESGDERAHFYTRPFREPETISPHLFSRSKRKTALASFNQNTYLTALANVHYQSRTINLGSVFEDVCNNANTQQQFETSISVLPKPWLFGWGFALSYSTSGSSWIPQFGFQFRHYNVRSEDALIFEFCFSGNLEGVQALLRRGDASPFDCDPEGWTPLHVCSSLQHLGGGRRAKLTYNQW